MCSLALTVTQGKKALAMQTNSESCMPLGSSLLGWPWKLNGVQQWKDQWEASDLLSNVNKLKLLWEWPRPNLPPVVLSSYGQGRPWSQGQRAEGLPFKCPNKHWSPIHQLSKHSCAHGKCHLLRTKMKPGGAQTTVAKVWLLIDPLARTSLLNFSSQGSDELEWPSVRYHIILKGVFAKRLAKRS